MAPLSYKRRASCLGIIAGLIGVLLWASGSDAKSSSAPPRAVTQAPACDYRSHPKITSVKPDTVKPARKSQSEAIISGPRSASRACLLVPFAQTNSST